MASVLDRFQGPAPPPSIMPALEMITKAIEGRRKQDEERQKQAVLTQIGQAMAGGNFPAAASTAFAAGEGTMGLKIHELSIEQKKLFGEKVGIYAAQADTEEEWEALRGGLTKLTGSDPGDFETGRPALLAEVADLDTVLGMQKSAADTTRDEKRLGLEEQRVGLEAQRVAIAEAEAAAKGGKPSAGYIRTEDGSVTFEPGGPADPEVIRAQAEARAVAKPPRPLPQTSIDKLGEVGASYTDFQRLSGTFNDRYGGYVSDAIGDLATISGRKNPFASEDQVATADWWQDYQTQKNVVRNKLFGSALTIPEKQEFEKANISPGMRPDIIRKNLERQTAAATRAAKKLANVWLTQGYDPDVIEAAIGVPLSELGLGDLVAGPAEGAVPAASKSGTTSSGQKWSLEP